MFKKNNFLTMLILMAMSSLFMLTGCSRPPTQEIAKAEETVLDARQKEADIYVPDMFKKAEESLKKARELVVNKKYKDAKIVAEETIKFSQQAIALIEQGRAKIKAEAKNLMESVQKDLEAFKILSAEAIKKKVFANSEGIQGAIGKWEIDMVNIREKLQNRQEKNAYDQLKEIKEEVNSRKLTIEDLISEKTGEKQLH